MLRTVALCGSKNNKILYNTHERISQLPLSSSRDVFIIVPRRNFLQEIGDKYELPFPHSPLSAYISADI